ncbi:MAG: alpha/beta hydrolase [Desulfobacteraceae bacterium]|nr:alpha/beta hydrolase [Desulfobacteraceae bacterium]
MSIMGENHQPDYPEVTLPNTQLRHFASSIVDQEYSLFISLPLSMGTSVRKYPVLYMLDANAGFCALAEIARLLSMGNEIHEMIIVGISYPGGFKQWQTLRTRDYTPSVWPAFMETQGNSFLTQADYRKIMGGAESFLDFIRDELKPFVEQNYPVESNDSGILGDSFGGLFALFSLLTRPDTFSRYIIGSPSIWWDNAILHTIEQEYASVNTDLAANVFMSVGSAEDDIGEQAVDKLLQPRMLEGMRWMAKTLKERNYKSLELTEVVLEGESHLSAVAPFINKGLKTIYGI